MNKTIEILHHEISYYYDKSQEMPNTDQEHIIYMIQEGYSSGELNDNGNYGWWHIVDKEKQIAELQEKLSQEQSSYSKLLTSFRQAEDKLHRRNMLIKTLQKDKAECYRLSALLGRLGYDLQGNKE